MMQYRSFHYEAANSAFVSPVRNVSIQAPASQVKETVHGTSFEDTQTEEVASFLLSLKHGRSVSPEPFDVTDQQVVFNKSNEHSPMAVTPAYEQSPGSSINTKGRLGSVRTKLEKESSSIQSASAPLMPEDGISYDFAHLLDNSELVLLEDRDLVPDALFVAMSQMKVCHLTQADRVGCYKSRDIGFKGMSCKHCGGQPGFGRFYPNSVRSLAQTTTSQTILKHIGGKCRYAPVEVRDAVVQLQHEQAVQEGMTSGNGRPRYGSRKVFFQRVWERLHGEGVSFDDDAVSKVSSASSTGGMSFQSDGDDRSMLSGDSAAEETRITTGNDKNEGNSKKRKTQSCSLPLSKPNKARKLKEMSYEI